MQYSPLSILFYELPDRILLLPKILHLYAAMQKILHLDHVDWSRWKDACLKPSYSFDVAIGSQKFFMVFLILMAHQLTLIMCG